MSCGVLPVTPYQREVLTMDRDSSRKETEEVTYSSPDPHAIFDVANVLIYPVRCAGGRGCACVTPNQTLISYTIPYKFFIILHTSIFSFTSS